MTLIEGTNELLKEQGGPLTHLSDGLGYYVAQKFPINREAQEPVKLRAY